MRKPSLVLSLAFGLMTVSVASAARPDDVFAIVDAGPLASEITGLSSALAKNFPSAPPVTVAVVPSTLGQLLNLAKLDGVATNKPLHAVVLNPSKFSPALLLVVPVADAAALNASVATGSNLAAHIKGGYAVVGNTAALTAAEAFAASLAKQPSKGGVHLVAFLQPIWAAFGAQFVGVRQMVGGMIAAQKDAPVSADTVNAFFDNVQAAVMQSDELHVDAATVGTQIAFSLALKAKPSTAIDRFIAAQHAATFAGLDRLAAGLSPMLMAGNFTTTPESAALVRGMLASIGKITDDSKLAAFAEFQKLWDGDIAMGFDIPKPNSFTLQSVISTTDSARVAALLPVIANLTDGITANLMKTTRINKPSYTYDGLTVSSQVVSQELKTPPVNGKPTKVTAGTQWAADDHALLSVSETDPAGTTDRMHKLIDAAHDHKNTLQLSPLAQASLQKAKAAKATFWSYFDLDKIAAASGTASKTALPDIGLVTTYGDHLGKLTMTFGE